MDLTHCSKKDLGGRSGKKIAVFGFGHGLTTSTGLQPT